MRLKPIRNICFLIIIIFFVTACEKDNMFNMRTFDAPEAIYNFPDDKLWKHRVNTASEAVEAFKSFNGVELDVFYISELNQFQTGHDYPSGINLEDYLDSIANCNTFYYWIDFKNLNAGNVHLSVEKLKQILAKYELFNKVIVENSNPDLLAFFKFTGIYTSLWIKDVSETFITSYAENELYEDLEVILSKYQFNAVSAHYNMVSFMGQYLRKYNCHIWTNGLITESDKQKIKFYASKRNIKVILVDYNDNFMK